MNNADKRIEELLNRAGQTISDLPKAGEFTFAHSVNNPHIMFVVEKAIHDYEQYGYAEYDRKSTDDYRMAIDYILHLADVIDRFEWALENQVTLHENLMHVISNADIPDGVSYDQFCLVVDNIYKAIQTAQEGWENYEAGAPIDGSVDDE